MIEVNGIEIKPTVFPDGTSQVWHLPTHLLESYGASEVIVKWRFSSEAEVMHIAQLKALLDVAGVGARLDIRTLPYARQDKPIGNDATFALRPFADVLNLMGWASVQLHDPHSQVALDLIERSVAHYYLAETEDAALEFDADVLCFPDLGARSKYSELFPVWPVVSASKHRDQATGHVVFGELTGSVYGHRVLIVDDICDGGATFIGVAKALREAGAVDVALFVSHGIFSKGLEPLVNGGISRIFTPEREVTP